MEDKLLHVIVGILIVVLVRIINPKLVVSTLIISAVGKELFDRYIQSEKFDIIDAVVTIVAGLIILKLIKNGDQVFVS